MAYQINKYNGDKLVQLDDGTLDRSTSIGLIGKNFAGYGEIQNENFVFLLENFAGNNAPPKALVGQIWYDASTKRLRVNTGPTWTIVGNTVISATEPTEAAPGDGWLDTTDNKFYVYDGTQFVFVGAESVAGYGKTRNISTKLRDTTGSYHPVILSTLNDTVVAITAERDFTINALDAVPGFTQLSKGITVSSSSKLRGDVVGNADTATKLAAPKNINGVAFDGTANITIKALTPYGINASQFIQGSRFDGSSEITWSINATANNVDDTIVSRDSLGNFSASRITADLTGNTTGTHYGPVQGAVTGTSVSASLGFSGNLQGNVQGNLTGNTTGQHNGVVGNITPSTATFTSITISDQLVTNGSAGTIGYILKSQGANQPPVWGTPVIDLSNQVTNILSVPHGGTGRSSLTTGNVLLGAGAGNVNFVAPGTQGNVLTSTGGTWISAPNGTTGQVAYFAMAVPPPGWLICDGTAVSRVDYPNLFAAISTIWGSGDGVNTFNLPDLRGEFVRGLDIGRGVDTGRVLGTRQDADVGPHTHDFKDVYGFEDDGASDWVDRNGNKNYPYPDDQYFMNDEDGDYGARYALGRTEPGGNTETRPRNVALLPCIKT